MNNLAEKLGINWSAMTTSDWIGLTVTLVIFTLMTVLYIYVFSSRNREKMEAHRHIVINDDSSEKEGRNE